MQHNRYGLFISLTLHLIVLMIPVSIVVSKHFKEIELFVMDERPLQPVQKKVVKTKPKDPPKEIREKVQPEPVITESAIKETPVSNIIEPTVISKTEILVPHPPETKPAPPVLTTPLKSEVITETAPPKPLVDVEFGSKNAPRFLHREMPIYPMIARRLGKEGKVLLRLTIDEKGNLLNIEVIEGAGYGFTEAAIEAVKKSTFMPAVVDGKAVISRALLPVRFILRRD